MSKFQFKKIIFLTALAVLTACNTTKYVPEGEHLLNKVRVQSDTKVVPKQDIQAYIRQTPNSRMFIFGRTQLGIYNLSSTDTSKWVNRWLRRIGEEPVIYSPLLTNISEKEIQKHFFNKGFMNAQVKSEASYPKKKQVDIKYIITANEPYYLRGYTVNIPQRELADIAADSTESLVRSGNLFDTDVLDNERSRITKKFRDKGYFNFQKDYLHYYADSTHNARQVDLVLELNDLPALRDTAKNNAFRKYTINKIYYYSETDQSMLAPGTKIKLDTVAVGYYDFVYEKRQNIRPSVLIESTHILPGAIYSDLSVEKTYSSLNALSAVKYMNISFQQKDSAKLDCFIRLTPNKLQSLSTDLEGTYSAGYWGAGVNVNYGHQNAFLGSEAITARGRFAYEYQGSGQKAIEVGGDLGVKFPTFLFPFATLDLKRKIRANTQFTTTFSYRNRPREYTGVILGGGWKYNWSELANVKHTFDLIDLSYVRYPRISKEYEENFFVNYPAFRYNFQNHFIMRMGYSGTYTTFNPLRPLQNYTAMLYGVEVAGNALYAINKIADNKRVVDETQSYYTLFKIRFAQYAKFDYSISHHQIFDENNRIVYHAGLGVAVPYGNTRLIPFEKRYFAGGANSVRGWTAYQLGPGTYTDPKSNYINLNTQMGDVKIDLNMEYRAKLFWKLDAALFLDAGNVWTIRNYAEQPGGAFKFKSFLEQFGVAYGAGLRLDFSFFVIRLDGGLRLHNPALSRTERWRMKPTRDDYAFNLAIGYPF